MSPSALWEHVVAGDDLITEVPPGRWQLDPVDTGDTSVERPVSDRGGYVDGFDAVFDPHGFEIPADEIAALDPVFTWTLHTAREALRDAGHDSADPSRFGAIFGNLSFPSAGMAAFVQAATLADLMPGDRFARPSDVAQSLHVGPPGVVARPRAPIGWWRLRTRRSLCEQPVRDQAGV